MSMKEPGSVQRHLADMIAMERHLEEVLNQGREQATEHKDATQAIGQFQVMAKGHRKALEDRLHTIRAASSYTSGKEENDISEVLCQVYGAIGEAALGYAILHALAHRSLDREGKDNTRDLVKKHLQDYAQAASEINKLVSDAVVRELDTTGEECKCQCTTCALGICTCAPMGIGRANKEWLDAVSSGSLGSILVTTPRLGSAAARAGLQSGDVILAADGQEIHFNAELHEAIKKHRPGPLQLKVQRASGSEQDITLIC